jgi:hypothetical protein
MTGWGEIAKACRINMRRKYNPPASHLFVMRGLDLRIHLQSTKADLSLWDQADQFASFDSNAFFVHST